MRDRKLTLRELLQLAIKQTSRSERLKSLKALADGITKKTSDMKRIYGVSTERHWGHHVKQYVDELTLLEAEQEFLCLLKPLHKCAYLIGSQKNLLCTSKEEVDLLMYEQGLLFRNPLSTYKRVEAWTRIQYEFPERHSANTKNPKKSKFYEGISQERLAKKALRKPYGGLISHSTLQLFSKFNQYIGVCVGKVDTDWISLYVSRRNRNKGYFTCIHAFPITYDEIVNKTRCWPLRSEILKQPPITIT